MRLTDLAGRSEVRVGNKEALDAALNRHGKALLVFAAAQEALFGRIADEGCFNQHEGYCCIEETILYHC